MVGRLPKPTALKVLSGNPGKRALNKNEPKPGGVPTCPSSLDATAKREWPSLFEREKLTQGGLPMITSVSGSVSISLGLFSYLRMSVGCPWSPKLQLKVSTAGRQWSIPATIWQPTNLKPSEKPPAPE
jgi:hypothetical protein